MVIGCNNDILKTESQKQQETLKHASALLCPGDISDCTYRCFYVATGRMNLIAM